jgi:hypothetical protein
MIIILNIYMGILSYIAKKFSCKSSCTYNADEELFNRESMSTPLSHYELKFKDIKKIMRILNKRTTIKSSRILI